MQFLDFSPCGRNLDGEPLSGGEFGCSIEVFCILSTYLLKQLGRVSGLVWFRFFFFFSFLSLFSLLSFERFPRSLSETLQTLRALTCSLHSVIHACSVSFWRFKLVLTEEPLGLKKKNLFKQKGVFFLNRGFKCSWPSANKQRDCQHSWNTTVSPTLLELKVADERVFVLWIANANLLYLTKNHWGLMLVVDFFCCCWLMTL